MHVTGEITLGNIFIIITLVGMAVGMGVRLGTISATLVQQALELTRHADRLDTYERRLVDVVGDVQRLIGRIEATQDRIEKRTGRIRGGDLP